ncbi:HAMP domain-containing histidine kinase [Paenibacillus sp. KQZ6P-2]|uniref:histidine kinase n=1 Tax=Paenibacillus mangrovi TaxID=2931978 RepID=A0A9X1WQ02_9BACL|nr:ATP-binding protein [Paenibacillus mangrovi]MCJ8011578.1 HAMP domain-containing histidine kinase [Paenibacillus mangrovi]
MFARTSRNLTFFYAGLMIVFLLLMNITSYFVLSSMIYKDLNEKLETVVTHEMKEHASELTGGPNQNKGKQNFQERDDANQENKIIDLPLRPFYILLNKQGNIVRTDAVDANLAHEITRDVRDWVPQEQENLHRVYHVEQKHIYLMLAGRAIYENGNYVGSIIAGIDMTDQRKILEQMTDTMIIISVLFFLVSIAFAYVMSRRAMKPIIHSFAKQQKFTADASHELRTPLTVLQSSLEVMESEPDGGNSPFGRQVMADMKEEVQRMSRLVADLLTLARADASAVRLTYEEFSFDEEFERVYRNFQPIAQQRDIDLEMQAATEAIVRADQERIRQLLVILLDNAVQYTSSGGKIVMRATVKGTLLTLQIQDTGIGIPADKLEEVFERFSRVDEARNRTHGHAGLGLSIAKWIVESHRGTIGVESEVGEGTIFIITFPIVIGTTKQKK